MRIDGRQSNDLRPVKVTPNILKYSVGSALIELGNTQVLCAVSLDNHAAPHLVGTGRGWVTAEYDMLPCSSNQRKPRDRTKSGIPGRSAEIQRLIGRSLRSVVEMDSLGERTFFVDCDVIQADGGTRTAAITGSCIALGLAMKKLVEMNQMGRVFLKDYVAATSVGIVEGLPALDLSYIEDSQAEVDMNVVMDSQGNFIEIQSSAEGRTFSNQEFNGMLELSVNAINQIIDLEKKVFLEKK